MKPLLFLFAFLLVAFQACAQHETLVIGKGGGIAGLVIQYKLTEKGKVYKGTGTVDIDYTLCSKIKKSEARKLFEEIKGIPDTAFHHPGNIYYFIQKCNESDTVRYTWGDTEFEAPEPMGTLYKNTMSRFSDLEFKQVK